MTSPRRPAFASHLSIRTDARAAVDELVDLTLASLGGTPDLALLFVSGDHRDATPEAARRLCELLGTQALIGCTGESIVGVGREVEMDTAMSLWLARLPGVQVEPMHLTFERTAEGGVVDGWSDSCAEPWGDRATLLLLGDPFTFPADWLLERLNEDRAGVRVVGGMASAAARPGDNRLILGTETHESGAVAVLLRGDVRLRTVVSQGCRPIGRPLVVTKADGNVLVELGGKRALLQLKEIFDALPNREQQLVQHGLHVGRVVNEYREQFELGDFLIRNVIGIDPREGTIAIGDFLRPGQTVQFHIRDQQTADEELRQLLAAAAQPQTKPGGALLFTCNGRGTRLFSQPHHDAGCVRDAWGDIPLAGFFAAGELGPVGNQNFMHGFTASLAVFEGGSADA
jgi:small ligand-binding sensory domain FIST